MEINKVSERKDGIKLVLIPKNSELKKGRYVAVIDIEDQVKQIANKEVEKYGRRK